MQWYFEELFKMSVSCNSHLHGAVTAKHPLHVRAFGSLFLGCLRGVASLVF